ncbi:rust resistance kinase Lr10-like isoform X2 [Arachis duranensis]|uniref:Rust resistance kinase Lr10-like isoform X2 n=1 Tax=Arachis duranensis TaxID=130453 RepID=A0A6P4BZY2_ARADU|nr:rust resistance kinase Lr10-like isoform X2 [Arachis duranensis]
MLSLCSFLVPLLLLLGISSYVFNNIYDSRWDSEVAIDANKTMCSSGWCGRHDIRYPFRLNNSSPSHCGEHRYTLSCENDNQLFLYLKSIKFQVQSINYNNYTIRLVDVNVPLHTHNHSSLPSYSLTSSNFTRDDPYQYWFYTQHFNDVITLTKQMVYLMRYPPYGVESSTAVANCMNGSYALGSTFYVSDLDKRLQDLAFRDSCHIDWMYLTSWPTEIKQINISCTDIHHLLLYGFELSWMKGYCYNDTDFAILGDHNNIVCYNNHYERSPFENYVLSWIVICLMNGTILFLLGKFGLGALFIVIFCICKWRRRHLSIYDSIEDFLRSDNNIMPIRYSYKEIKNITGKFKTKLGNGGYGSVFQGKLRSGRLVAVKVLNKAKSNGQEFINEVATIGRIHHVNVVQLIGFCVEGSKRCLVYELMQNGSLEKYIFSPQESASNSLSCEKLYNISLGVARGIEYLHNGCDIKILHFDIKPHNILLDEKFNPKVSDFGLARLYPTDKSIVSLTAARGTIGYMAPELFYRNVGTISYKADVYSFGMLLMEMASRRKNLNALTENSSQIYFPFWVYDQLQDGREITIENDTDEEMKLAKKMMIVALWCIHTKPNDRPSMKRVVEMLEQDEDLLEMPPKPYFYPLDEPADEVREENSSRLFSVISSVTGSKE